MFYTVSMDKKQKLKSGFRENVSRKKYVRCQLAVLQLVLLRWLYQEVTISRAWIWYANSKK
jgi:hypothetical protein